jgi:hypothetical protein
MTKKAELWGIAQRYLPDEVVIRLLPVGVLTPAWCHKPRKMMQLPRPDTPMGLLFWLHECGHWHLDPWKNPMPGYELEFEAEHYALEALRRHGVTVTREMLKAAKDNVRGYIRPTDDVPARIRRWLK